MGQKQAKEQVPVAKSNYNPEVEVVQQKIFEPHYGEVKIVKDEATGQLLILKEVVVNTKQAFDTELEFLNSRIELGHPNVAEIVGYNSKDQHNFCSTYYKIKIYIEVLENTLLTELENRIGTQTHFNESEVLLVADNLISGLSYFQAQGFSHGDIRPYNIFVQGNTYKLSDPSLSAHKGQHGLHLAIIQGQKTLLAPELVSQVPSSNFEIKSDRNKADVFSLGVTLLSLASLSNCEDLYDYQAGNVNDQLLNEKLENIRYRYSPYTWDLIRSMLNVGETERPDFVSLSNTLLPYQDQIRASAGQTSHHVQGESVKRSALPEDHTTTTGYDVSASDDLEARIKAALERSEATFKAVAARDTEHRTGDLAKSYVSNDVHATGSYGATTGANNYTTTNYAYTSTNYGATGYGSNPGSAGLGRSGVNQGLSGSGVNQHLGGSGVHQVEHSKKSALPADNTLAQSGSYNNYTTSYVPSSYNYTSTTTYGTGATGATGANAGSYTPGGSYNYTSSYVPSSTAGNYGATSGLATSTYAGTGTAGAYGTTSGTYGTTSGTYGTSTTHAHETVGTTAYGSTSGTYGASTTPKAYETGVYGSAAGAYGAASTTPKAHETVGTSAYGTTSGTHGASTTPKAHEAVGASATHSTSNEHQTSAAQDTTSNTGVYSSAYATSYSNNYDATKAEHLSSTPTNATNATPTHGQTSTTTHEHTTSHAEHTGTVDEQKKSQTMVEKGQEVFHKVEQAVEHAYEAVVEKVEQVTHHNTEKKAEETQHSSTTNTVAHEEHKETAVTADTNTYAAERNFVHSQTTPVYSESTPVHAEQPTAKSITEVPTDFHQTTDYQQTQQTEQTEQPAAVQQEEVVRGNEEPQEDVQDVQEEKQGKRGKNKKKKQQQQAV